VVALTTTHTAARAAVGELEWIVADLREPGSVPAPAPANASEAAASTVRSTGMPATLACVKDAAASPAPAADKPGLAADERAERLKLLAQRLRDPDGLDRWVLSHEGRGCV